MPGGMCLKLLWLKSLVIKISKPVLVHIARYQNKKKICAMLIKSTDHELHGMIK